VYKGRAGGSYFWDKGGGSNPQCLPLNPNYYTRQSGSPHYAYMYGAE